jgi:hypothetical protein
MIDSYTATTSLTKNNTTMLTDKHRYQRIQVEAEHGHVNKSKIAKMCLSAFAGEKKTNKSEIF